MSVRLKLTLSYAGFLMLAGTLLLAVVWLFLLRYVPDRSFVDEQGAAPARTDLIEAFTPRAIQLLAVLLVFALVGGWILAGRMLAPLKQLTEASRIAGPGQLDHRVRLNGPNDEFRELADSFDNMLDQIEAHVAEQQRFAANASHELRTPLATSQAILDVARSDPQRSVDPVTTRDLDRLQSVNTRAIELTQSLLLLSRAGQRLTDSSSVDLSLMVDEAEELLVPAAERRGVEVETSTKLTPERDLVTGSEALLSQLATNLMQNAIVHNLPQDGKVWVSTFRDSGTSDEGGSVVLRVENTGPAVDPASLSQLTEPFRRGEGRTHRPADPSPDPERLGGPGDHAGAGLGLAIVQRIITTHGGTLQLTPRPDGGLRVDAVLPADIS